MLLSCETGVDDLSVEILIILLIAVASHVHRKPVKVSRARPGRTSLILRRFPVVADVSIVFVESAAGATPRYFQNPISFPSPYVGVRRLCAIAC